MREPEAWDEQQVKTPTSPFLFNNPRSTREVIGIYMQPAMDCLHKFSHLPLFLIVAFCTFHFAHLPLTAQELHDGQTYFPANSSTDTSTLQPPTEEYIGFYQRFLSPVRGSRCAMFPSCSNYGLQAFRKFSFPKAMMLTADRMIRCGHDSKYYDRTYEYGYAALADPIPGTTLPRNSIVGRTIPPKVDRTRCHTETDSIRDFIRLLIQQGNYNAALLETERIAYFRPQLADSSLFLLRMLCYDGMNREEEALFDYSLHAQQPQWQSTEIRMQAAKMYHELGNYKGALDELAKITSADPEIRKQVLLGAAASSLRAGCENEAICYVKQAQPYMETTQWQSTQSLLAHLSQQRTKRPLMAGLFSIIPGGGYLYNRQPGNALTSLLVNGLLAYATYSSINRKNYGVAGVMGVFSLTFYAGNFLGAINGAKRYNNRRLESHAKRFEKLNAVYQ